MDRSDVNPYIDGGGKPQLVPSVTAFVDILGYVNYIEAVSKAGRGQDELIRLRHALNIAYEHVRRESTASGFSGMPGMFNLQVRTFTDHLVIAYPTPGDTYGHLLMIIDFIGYIQAEMANHGYFMRGAIAIGDLYVDNDIVFGPALIEAHRAEKYKAVYPRVILCDSAINAFHESWRRGEIQGLMADADGRIFIDYLDNTVMIAYPDDRPFTEYLIGHKDAVIAKIKEFTTNPYVRAKYDWAAIYHNAFCDRYPDLFGTEERIDSSILASPPKPWVVPEVLPPAPSAPTN